MLPVSVALNWFGSVGSGVLPVGPDPAIVNNPDILIGIEILLPAVMRIANRSPMMIKYLRILVGDMN